MSSSRIRRLPVDLLPLRAARHFDIGRIGLFGLLMLGAIASPALAASDDASVPPVVSDADAHDDTATAYDTGPLQPKAPRNEAEDERLSALAMYAAGRMHEEKEELPAALRMYQRATRFDPQAQTPLRDAIRMAFSLGRSDEAIR